MELQIIKKEMFFLLLYGVIFLAMSLLMIGLHEYNGMFYLFEWIWLWFFGMILSMVFLIKEESINDEEREQLLEKEMSEHKQTYIPFQLYAINALIQATDIFLICFELYFMSFGLFIICQAIVFVFYIIYTNKYDQLTIIYTGVVLLAGIFSLSLDTEGNEKCYIGLIATLFQIGTNIYTIKLKEEFMRQYIFQHSKYISYTGIIKFLIWTIIMVIVNVIPCPYDDITINEKCSQNGKLGYLKGFFDSTFSKNNNNNITYPVIVFVVLILVSSAFSYIDNKITIKEQSDKKQIIQQFVFFPLWIWLYQNKNVTLFVFCILFFLLQWLLGLYIIFKDKKITKHEQVDEDQDSEFS